MSDNKTQETYSFKNCLVSRIRNYSLTPNENNALLPVFEAITNSLHGIQDRLGDKWLVDGQINIYVYLDDETSLVKDIEIEDNGVGFNNENFDSFRTSDSQYKLKKGGKGIGRFSWLKAFENASIVSVFEENNKRLKRSFKFILHNDTPVVEHSLEEVSDPISTKIVLKNMKRDYSAKFPDKMDTVIKKTLIHFLPILIAGSPSIKIISGDNDTSDIRSIFSEHKYNENDIELETEEYGTLRIHNILMDRSCISGKGLHSLYFSANNRIVDEHPLNNQLGLMNAIDYEDDEEIKKVFYLGVVSGDFLDAAVFGERSSFDIRGEVKEKIVKDIITNIKENYLFEQIQELLNEKAEKIGNVLRQYPRYQYMVKDNKEWAKDKLSPASRNEEDIFKELSVYDYRENKEIQKNIKKIIDGGVDTDDFSKAVEETVSKINEVNKSALCEYIVKRKSIIDILQERLGYEDCELKKKYKEEAIHKIICPMVVDSNDIQSMNHNLWVIDDRLAYYDYFASDKKIKTFIQNSNSGKEPDLILFNGCTAYNRPNQNQPVVIVEFKRPARDDYTDDENPISQVCKYIDDLRGGKVVDGKGRKITEVKEHTPFFCYIVCDITDSLRNVLRKTPIVDELPGDRGIFGYMKTYNAYFEILDFKRLVDDARLRNEAFFHKLGML